MDSTRALIALDARETSSLQLGTRPHETFEIVLASPDESKPFTIKIGWVGEIFHCAGRNASGLPSASN